KHQRRGHHRHRRRTHAGSQRHTASQSHSTRMRQQPKDTVRRARPGAFRGRATREQTGLDASTARIRAKASAPADRASVIVASERMDDDPGWRLLQPGELLHVGRDLTCRSRTPFDPPAHLLRLADLEPTAAASHHPTQPG
ncbi:MAG TPA: hypothetical protein VFU36_04700, partial [Jatrophihabitans sp.]|nr:hypothetical protein [Jatrophihabitans sp.]